MTLQKLKQYVVHTTEGRQIAWSANDLHDLFVRVTERGHMVRYVEDSVEYFARTGEEL